MIENHMSGICALPSGGAFDLGISIPDESESEGGWRVNPQNRFTDGWQQKLRSRRARWLSHRANPFQPPEGRCPANFWFCLRFFEVSRDVQP
jgi:hypothetical protein